MKFSFTEKSHKYKLDDAPLLGTTTVLGMINKPALIQWAANLSSAYALSLDKVEGIDKEWDMINDMAEPVEKAQAKGAFDKKYPQFKESRTRHAHKRDKASDLGTDVHAEIEKYIRTAIKYQEECVEEYPGNNDNVQVQHFIDWSRKNHTKFIASELVVFDADMRVGGTCDILSVTDGIFYFDDIKTSSGIYDNTAFAQVNGAYRNMIYWMLEHLDDDIEIDVPNGKWKSIREYFEDEAPSLLHLDKFPKFGSRIINIKKTGKFDENKDIYYSNDFPRDVGIFKACLTLYKDVPFPKKKLTKKRK